ncbi:MAG: hypothetical protein WCI73_19070 [Phycisphaerae bacterium]
MKTIHWTTAAVLATSLLAACGKEEAAPTAPTPGTPGATKTLDQTKDAADAAKTAADVSKTTADAAKTTADEAKVSADAAKVTADAAKTSADAAKGSATVATNSLIEQAKPLLEQATAYIKENKVELADKAVTQLEGIKDKLPAEWAGKIADVRKALDALKAGNDLQKKLPAGLKIGG